LIFNDKFKLIAHYFGYPLKKAAGGTFLFGDFEVS
jgi:hypothetical protein